MTEGRPIRAALFDFGGVILSSPFEAFARYEAAHGLPDGFLRRVNATDPDTNAWARLERNEVDVEEFCALFEAEARALGGEVDAAEVLALLRRRAAPGDGRGGAPLQSERLGTALLTNNVVTMRAEAMAGAGAADRPHAEVLGLFDVIVESSVVGVRKPDPVFYERACADARHRRRPRRCSSTTWASTSSRPGPWA